MQERSIRGKTMQTTLCARIYQKQENLEMNTDKCIRKCCKREYDITYLGKNYCWHHWSQLCDQEMKKEIESEQQPKQYANIIQTIQEPKHEE